MAEWEAIKIHDVVQDISEKKIVLPVIQRNLVWVEEKMELLYDSLLKGNSFGGIMALEEERGSQPLFAFRYFSKDGDPQYSALPEVLDQPTMLIIDGQQRLQTFYMGLMGGINGKNLFFNLFSQDDFEFEFAHSAAELPAVRREEETQTATFWYPVNQLYTRLNRVSDDTIVSREIITTRGIQDENQKEWLRSNVHKFEKAIFTNKALGISKVFINKDEPDVERRRMVELFRRLNDGGTRLSALDLAASVLKGFDYRLETFLRRDIPAYQDIGFDQDEVIKLIFLLQDNAVKEVTDITRTDADFAIEHAPRILKTLDVLRQLLKDMRLYDYYREGGRSAIPLYFIAYHIFYQPPKTEQLGHLYDNYDANNPDFTNIKRWVYLSLLNAVFSRGRGWIPYRTGIRKLLRGIQPYKGGLFPADELFAMYESHPVTFSQTIHTSQLHTWDMSFVFYLIYGYRPLSGRDIDHIQPKSLLGWAGVTPEKIHSIRNYQLLDADTNRDDKRAKELKEWVRGWKDEQLLPYLDVHLIPRDTTLWELDRFDDFLAARAEMIVEKVKQAIPPQSTRSQPTQPAAPAASPAPSSSPLTASGYPAAAVLSSAQRNPEAWLTGYADHVGNGPEFRKIVAAARAVGLHARFQNVWWIVMLTHPKNRNQGFIDLGTSLSIWVHSERIADYLDCPAELVKEKLLFTKQLQREDVDRWVENLVSLFAKK